MSFSKYIGHPLRLTIHTAKSLAFGHLVWQWGYCWGPATGPSMLPTMPVWGEGIVVSRLHANGKNVKVGDTVMYKIPINDQVGVKRVIGMPGDYVLMNTPESGNHAMIQVPQGHCWLVGDNLTASRDSRTFGPVPMALIKGKCIAKGGWPWDYRWIENPLEIQPESP